MSFVELLSVMILIALLGILVFPSVTSMLKKAKENKYNSFLSNIFMATEAYIQNNASDFSTLSNTGDTVLIPLNDLVQSNYVKSSLVDPSTSERISTCSGDYCSTKNYTIQVTKTEIGTYSYKLYNRKITYDTNILEATKSLVYSANSCKTGNTYSSGCYLTGAQTNNYVYFNGNNWRIMGIDSNNNVKLIYDGVKNQVTFNNLASTYTSYYNNLTDYMKNTITTVKSIDNDEYSSAGGSNSYLNLGEAFWTDTASGSNAYFINSSGQATTQAKTSNAGFRPVIIVKGTSAIGGGNGTIDNKYRLIGNISE